MADVFISYSRQDSEFVQRLNNAFINAGRLAWVDWQNIPRGEDWWREIERGIEEAESFIVVVSQHWLTSEICHKELGYARQNGKRVLPLIRERIQDEVEKQVEASWAKTYLAQTARDNWEAIRHINWINFDDDHVFENEFRALLKTLDEDQPHIKAHTRYQNYALEWERSGRNPSFLLAGDNLAFAENWQQTAVHEGKIPPPTELHRTYLAASRQAEDTRIRRARRLRQVSVGSVAVMVVAIVAGVFSTTSVVQLAREANRTLNTVNARLSEAEQQGAALGTQVSIAGATLSPVSPTLTAVASAVLDAQEQQDMVRRSFTASIQLNDGERVLAQRSADAMVAQYPDRALSYVSRGLLFSRIKAENALADFNKAIELDPRSANAYFGRAVVYEELGSEDAALTDYTHAIELDASYTLAYFNRGRLFANLGKPDAALADYNKAIELDPKLTPAYLNRGIVYDSQGDGEAALADFNQAIALDPTYALAYNNRGSLYYERHETEAALVDFNQAIAVDPNYPLSYLNRGQIQQEQGKTEAALADYTQAIALDPKLAQAYSRRGQLYDARMMYDEATADYSKVIELEPNDPLPHYNRAVIYNRKGKYEAALADYNKAIELDATLTPAYLGRGTIYAQQNQFDAALADYNSAIRIDPRNVSAYFFRGSVYYFQGQYAFALADWQTADRLGYAFSPQVRAIYDQLRTTVTPTMMDGPTAAPTAS
jgi:tetratricopeptide (TPR) repeat protein